MPRKVEIALPSYQTDEVVAEIKQLHELIGLRVQRDVSIQPPGDLITVEVTNLNNLTGFLLKIILLVVSGLWVNLAAENVFNNFN